MSDRKEFPARPAILADEIRALLDASPPRTPIWQSTPEAARAEQRGLLESRPRGPDMANVQDLLIDSPAGPLPIRLYRPPDANGAAILYFHGGGWVIGSIDDSDAHVRRLAIATGCTMLSIGYRLAPEHPFPAAIEDALAGWTWAQGKLRAPDGAPGILAIAGDSAGGNIAAGATIALRAAGGAMPAFLLLGYPVLSGAMDSASYHDQRDGPVLTAGDMAWFWNHYAPDAVCRRDPRAAPLEAPDLTGLPPTMILTAECDPLRDEGQAYAERLRAAGVDTGYRCYAGMVHGFYKMTGNLDGSRAALADVGAFVRRQLAAMSDRPRIDVDRALI